MAEKRGGAAVAEREPSLATVLGVFVVLAAILERGLTLLNGSSRTYILCDDVPGLSGEYDRATAVNRWLLLAGLVLAVAGQIVSRIRRHWRALPRLALCAVLVLVVLADGFAARGDGLAARIQEAQT
ncbi:hypothetical protein ACFPC0_21495 [Streptomyces andamanensis]|uniref:DUF998 domain-containing protein n=1 Tax=Streptomyces andamanensis TaxID=1565035 RepID=A0ABV8TI41_9ACTN